jgi:hypothetical protein
MYHCDACPKRFVFRGRWQRHYWAQHGMFAQQRRLPWEKWVDEQQARQEPAVSMYRPSLTLPHELMQRVDRVAAVQGIDRSELVQMMIEHHLASWREMPA